MGLSLAPCDTNIGGLASPSRRGCVLATPATPLAMGALYRLTLPAATAVNEEGSVTSSELTARRRRPQAVAPSRSRGRSLWPAAEVCSLQPKSVAPGLGAA